MDQPADRKPILIESADGNCFADAGAQRDHLGSIDWVDLTWEQCCRRAVRATTRGGQALRILLKLGESLHHGDILQRSGDTVLAVHLLPCDVIVAHPRDANELAAIAYELGNLHVPMQLAQDDIVTLLDGPIEAALSKLAVAYQIESRRFEPTSKPIGEITLGDGFGINAR